MNDKIKEFEESKAQEIKAQSKDAGLRALTEKWFLESCKYKYSYHFSWLGRPIIQFPQDVVAIQELIWRIKPDLIIETGIAHGGSLILSASILELIGGTGEVLGIDVDIRQHNRVEIEAHPMKKRISMIEGSSIDQSVAEQVKKVTVGKERVMVILDSNHTHEHVLKELELYSPLVTKDSYLLIFDTIIEEMPEGSFPDRPWSKTDNPKTAVREFMKSNDRFETDTEFENKLLLTVAPEGYLKCVKE